MATCHVKPGPFYTLPETLSMVTGKHFSRTLLNNRYSWCLVVKQLLKNYVKIKKVSMLAMSIWYLRVDILHIKFRLCMFSLGMTARLFGSGPHDLT